MDNFGLHISRKSVILIIIIGLFCAVAATVVIMKYYAKRNNPVAPTTTQTTKDESKGNKTFNKLDINKNNYSLGGGAVLCTMDAMLCPDGTYVGRTGPNCEFVCPGGNGSTNLKGFLQGQINIGPLCPVQKFPPDPKCQPTRKTFEAWPVAVWTPDKKTKVADITPDLDGTFKIELPVGKYVVDLNKQNSFGVGGNNLPMDITIISSKVKVININIDTGIR